VKRVLREEGIALVMALGITVVLIIFVASMISYTSENSRNANVSNSRLGALVLAESGIASAVSILNEAANVASPTLLGCTASGANSTLPCTDIAVSVPGGTAYVHGMYTAGASSTGTWAITCVGGKVVISGNNASIGTAAHPITSGYSAQGCASTIGGTPHPCTTADKWYVGKTDTPLTATPPTTDYAGTYASASPGPNHLCDTTLTPSPNLTAAANQPHAFDNDATMNGTNTAFNLTPSSDYNCVTASGQLSWNHTTHILTVAGTIFFDGNLTTSGGSAMYHGKATLYVNGEFLLNGNNASLRAGCPSSPATPTHQCAFGNTSPEWNDNTDMLLIVTNKPGATSVDMSGNNVQFQSDLMCPATSTANLSGNNVIVEGGIICGKFSWGNNPLIYPLPTITNLPPGAPVPPNAPATVGIPIITGG
jgi:Tfp pilus assembly protein PilX